MKEKFEKIDDYLSGDMNDQEKTAFENDLVNDEELSKEFSFRKDVHRLMTSSPRDAFKDNLANVDAAYVAPKSGTTAKGKWNILLFALIGIAIVGIVTLQIKNLPSAPEESSTPSVSTPELPKDNQKEVKQEEPAKNTTQKEEETKPKSPPKTEQTQAPKPKFYADNALLENAIGSNLRGNYKWSIKTPLANTSLAASNGKATFHLIGMLETDDLPGEDFELILEIYSNEEGNFEQKKSILSQPLGLSNDEAPFMFDYSVDLSVEPRLYYYLIKDDFTGAVLYGGKFRVVNE